MVSINLSNKTFYTLIAILAVLVVSGIAYASLQAAIPNPGHQLSELQKCSEGETLVMQGGNWNCTASGGSGNQKVCYCLWCEEGGSSLSDVGPSCGEAGAWTPRSDTTDGPSGGGCKMQAWLTDAGSSCNYPTPHYTP